MRSSVVSWYTMQQNGGFPTTCMKMLVFVYFESTDIE